ncbi:uncharacterized protein LOC113367761 [Ctenocephalides felis]|uniref:uncharacterized protein LOC113367761 n=1 Tax=Ctenocephalides felis TaxID=7515 RepID=UPI000E6E251D|nr:uncharacterized protein LOC113367761 [Ctenocephalides felis]
MCMNGYEIGHDITDTKLWKEDLSESMDLIEPSTEGLQKVHLKCGPNTMHVKLETEENFTGVMYTRGSFHTQRGPCFGRGKGSRALSMTFPLDDCQTNRDGEVYSNVVVVQHDPDLVTPGDAAFTVECDFRKPRDFKVKADMNTEE